jgi:fibronectin-binding autotransporter adhesin
LTLLIGLAAGPAVAADYYWDADGSGVQLGGTGTWNTTTPALWNSTGNAVAGPFFTWDNAAGHNAIFGGTAGTVTLGAPITVHNITFNASGYTIAGTAANPLTLTGTAPTFTVVTGVATISAAIAGTAGLTKAGGGTLLLSGDNTFSGNVNVNAGTLNLTGTNSFTGAINVNGGILSVSSNAALGNASNVVNLANGTTLATGPTGGSLAGRTVNLMSGQASINGAGAGFAHYTGAGGLTIAAVNSTGPITMRDDTNDFTGSVSFTVNGSATFTSVRNVGEASALGAGNTITFVAADIGSDFFNYTGDGDTSDRDWAISFAGGVSSTASIQNSGTGKLTLSGDISVNGVNSTPIALAADQADLELSGTISGASSHVFRFLALNGNTITLGNQNSFSGAAQLEGGVVRVSKLADGGVTSSLGVASNISLLGGTLSYTGTATSSNRTWTVGSTSTISNDGSGALTLSGGATLNAGSTLTFGGSYTGGVNTFSGVISGTGNLGSSGTATWVLTGANTRTGTIKVDGGTLRAGNAQAFGTVTDVTVNGGTLDLNGNNLAPASLNGTGGTVALGSANLTLNLGTGITNSYGGSITGTGSLTKLGAGTLTLTGASTYTGATTVGGGTLALDFSPAGGPTGGIISASSALIMNGGTVKITGAAGETNVQEFGGLTITTGNNTVSATSGTGGMTTVNLGDITRTGGLANFVLPTAGAITTTGADRALGGWATVNGSDYAKVEGGNIIAFTDNDYVQQDNASLWQSNQILSDAGGNPNTPFFNTVGATIQVGGLQYTAAANSTVTVANGQTLGVDGTIIVAPSVGTRNQTITGGMMTGTLGGGVLGVQQNGTATGTVTSTFTIASTIVDNTGPVGFSKAGTGKVALTGSNTYTGATIVSQGTLSINSVANADTASAIGAASVDPSNLVIQGATLEYTGASASTNRGLTLARSGAANAGTIVVTGTANLTVSGQVVSSDGATFIKDGPGTLTLSNANNTYAGITTIMGGTLAVTTLANGGQPSSIGSAGNASSNLVLQGGGELEYLGGTASSNRGFTLGTQGGRIDVAQGGTTLTLGGVATGAGGLTKNGAGTLVLSGTNTYTGGTTVNAGILRAGSAQAFGTGLMTVNAGAVLDLAGFANTAAGLSGGGSLLLGAATLTVNGNGNFTGTIGGTGGFSLAAGTQTLGGCGNTYSGATTLTGNSILNVGCLANGLQPSDIGQSSNASTNLVFNNGALNYTGGIVTTDRGFTLQGGTGAIGVANAAATLTFSGKVTGAGMLRKDGPGTLILSGTNDYTGGTATSIDGGTLRAGSTSAFGIGTMFLRTNTTLDLADFSNTVTALLGDGSVTLGSATLTISDGGNQTFSGAISGSGGLVKTGTRTQVLSGTSSYTGSTTINGGVLSVTSLANGLSNSSIGASAAVAGNLVLNGGTLSYTGTGGSTDRQFTLGANGGGLDASGTGGAINFTSTAPVAFADAGNRTLTLSGTNTANNTLAARIDNPDDGTTALTKTGTGTWVLANAASTYTGATTISGGVLVVDKLANGGEASSIGKSAKAASNLVIGSGSTLRYTGAGDTTDRLFTLQTGISFIESSGTGAIVFSNTDPAAYSGNGPRTLALGGTNTDFNIMGGTIVNGPGGTTTLAKNDSGTWVLTGNNTYTGSTVVNAGNLIIGNGGTTGNAGAGDVIVASADSTLSFNRSDSFNFDGSLSGAGTIAQIGTGTTVLTRADNEIGATKISAGTLQVDGGLTTPTVAMTGTSALTVNGTVGATGGAQAAITGDAGASTININAGSTLSANGDLGDGSDVVALAGTLDTGAARLDLGMGDDRLILNDGAAQTGAGAVGGEGTDTLQVNNAQARTLDAASVDGFEALDKELAGTLTLIGDHSYTGGTTIGAGTLQIGNGGMSGTLAGAITIANNATLAFNRSDDLAVAGPISGTGGVNQVGGGVTTLTGANSYTGATNVQAGTLIVNGDQSGATGPTSVASGATLGGVGTLGGNVTVADSGTISPGGDAAGTLTIGADLVLNDQSILNYQLGAANVENGGGPLNDLIRVNGNLTLAGTLNVTTTANGTFGPGIYHLIMYGGARTGDELNFGTMPADAHVTLQLMDGQVNLVNGAAEPLTYWDGDAGPKNNSVVNGGNGTWLAAGDDNWTESGGTTNGPFANGETAIFEGAAGTVTVDNSAGTVEVSGMTFNTDGYTITGDEVSLVGAPSTITVGTDAGGNGAATIGSALIGDSHLVKDGGGTLMLTGANTYTGGTTITAGTLQLGDGGMTGSITGDVTNNGKLVFKRSNTLTFANAISGTGAVEQIGTGTTVLSETNSYAGGTRITAGTLSVSKNENLGHAAGGLTFDGGTLQTTVAMTSARAVTLDENGGTIQTDADLTLSGGVTGEGSLTKTGTGTLVLSGTNTYTDATTVSAGTLLVNGDQSGATGLTSVASGATLGGTGTIGGDVTLADGGAINPGDAGDAPGTLTANGNVALAGGSILNYNFGQANVPGDAFNDLLTVHGDLTLGGTLNVTQTAGGSFGPGVYRVISYDGTLTNHGLGLGATPADSDLYVQTSVANQVNLVNTTGLTLNYWDGAAGPKNDRAVNGGDGTWQNSTGNDNWTESTGIVNAPYSDGAFAIFQGARGTVSVDAAGVSASGMQFAVDDYTLKDGTITLVADASAPSNASIIRVGDGTAAGAGYTATIASVLTGTQQLVKTDAGTLVLSGLNTYTGGTAINGGTVRISSDDNLGDTAGGLSFNGGTLNTTAGVTSDRDVTLGGAGIFLTDAGTRTTLTGDISGEGALTKDGGGSLVLTGDATHTGGTTITAGTLQVGNGVTSGTLTGDVANNGTLAFMRSDALTFGGLISGTGAVQQIGTGTTILTRDNGYTGGTTITAGTLQLGDGHMSGSIIGDVANNGTLAIKRSDALTFGGLISGTGGVDQIGSGTTTLTGNNSYAGATNVNAGTLLVNGDQSGAMGDTLVANSATLGGAGTIGGAVTVADGGAINPGGAISTPGKLTINGNLQLSANSILNYEFGKANVPGGTLNDLLEVGGDLTLDGTLNVTTPAGGSFGPGVYRVIKYAGQISNNNTLALGTMPADAQTSIQTAIPNQVNLVNTAGLTLRFWDGTIGPKNDGAINGGEGIWQNNTGNDNWTDQNGTVNAPYTDAAFAVFQGTAGIVTVDNSLGAVTVSGMQFDVDGYQITGNAIELVGSKATIRVGAGADGEDYVATIGSELTGDSELEKTDPGTLVLTSKNTYTGGTAINGGTVRISSNENLGAVAGGLSFGGGTLQTTADINSARDVTLAGTGTFLTDAGTTTTLTGAITGEGSLAKDGDGRLVVAGDARHTGGTTITAGTLQVGDGETSGTLAGDVTNNSALAFKRSDTSTFAGVISGTGAVQQSGTGTTILTGDSRYTGGTTIADGTLQLGNGGASGSLTGNVTDNGTLAFKRSDDVTFAGVISGTGGVSQIGPGATTLTANNSYAGPTKVSGGTLFVDGDQSGATGLTTVASGGTLGGTGIIGGDVSVADGAVSPGRTGPGTLTVNGNLALGSSSKLDFDLGQANVPGGTFNDLIKVGGNLTLDGGLNVATTPGGTFGVGLYRLINYQGTLTDSGLDVGAGFIVQTSEPNWINLVNTAGQALAFWDGNDGPKGNGVIDGGDGTWRANGDDNWTDPSGTANAAFTNGSFAVFTSRPGTVTVDNTNGAVQASGMQFATDGYSVQGGSIALVPSTGSQAVIRVGDGTAEGAGYTATIAAELTGSAGLAKTDLGTLALRGTNSYTGPTDIRQGTLAVDGSIGNSTLRVHDGARLTGNGTVGPTTVAAGGTIAPGHSIGTLHVQGPYSAEAGSTYAVEVDPSSAASDRVEVAGSADVRIGAVLNVTKTHNAPYKLGTRYTVLTTTDGLRGNFEVTGDTALSPFIGLTDFYDPNNAYLQVAQTRSLTSAAGTRNQSGAASALDGLPPTSALLTAILNLPDDAAARQALDQLSGEIHASVKTGLIEESHFARDAATDRIREAFCAVGANVTVHRAINAAAPPASDECGYSDRATVWGQVFGSWGHTDSDGNAASLSRSTGGFFLGADAPVLENWRVGVLGGYSRSSFSAKSRNSSAGSDDYHVGLYGGRQWGAIGLRFGATYTWHDMTTSRSVAFPGFSDTPTANYNAGAAQIFGDLGYRIDVAKAAFEPFANLAHVNLHTDGFTENGGSAVLRGRSDDTSVTFTTLGLRAATDLAFGKVGFKARGSLGWRHAFGDDTPSATLSFSGSSSFGTAGVPIAKDAAVLDAGLDFGISEEALLSLSYGGQFSTGAVDQSVRGNFSLKF